MRERVLRALQPMWARLVLAVVAPLVAIGLVAGVSAWVTALPSDAAFRADGVVTTRTELAGRIKMLGALYGIQQPEDPAQQDRFRRDAAKMVVLTSVIDHAARQRGIEVSEQAVQARLNELVAGLNPPGEDSFIRLLSETGASRPDVLDEIRRQIRSATLIGQVVGGPVKELGEADYQRYFTEHAAELAVPEQRHLRNIVVRTRAQADQVAQRAREGTDFAALVTESSLDRATRDTQGDLGVLTGDQLEPGYRDAAFQAPPGSVFGPVQTSSGWNVGRVDEVRPSVPRTYEQARDEVVGTVRDLRIAQTWNAWLSRQVEDADVRYADDYRPADPGAPPATSMQPVPGARPEPEPAG
ncbi:peptidylprolyl isomerase [Pseudonocardia spinosispora]|uniref:peptidylprolyl isomerase n=1 Tax=Pseudonocardia spinosispora TaxID=103441 RepID=UPI0007E8D626|nr:peptidylprolyl isomerase [Pseudonocardia spinosispora]